jgi:hypothetical protein
MFRLFPAKCTIPFAVIRLIAGRLPFDVDAQVRFQFLVRISGAAKEVRMRLYQVSVEDEQVSCGTFACWALKPQCEQFSLSLYLVHRSLAAVGRQIRTAQHPSC